MVRGNTFGRSRVYEELGIRKDLIEKLKELVRMTAVNAKGARLHLENTIDLSERITLKGVRKSREWLVTLVKIEALSEVLLHEIESYLLGGR